MRFLIYKAVPSMILIVLCAFAEVPRVLSYQGILTNANGSVVADGDYTLTFQLWDDASGGNSVWSETQTLTISDGVFNAMLGSVTSLGLNFDRQYWLGISVGSDAELFPRIQLSAAAYSQMAQSVSDSSITTAKLVDGAVTQDKLDPSIAIGSPWNQSGNTISYLGSRVGIRTATPTSALSVQGDIDVRYSVTGSEVIRMYNSSVGRLELKGLAGSRNVYMTWTSGNEDRGFMGIFDPNSDLRAYFQINSNNVGNMVTRGANNNSNVVVGQLSNYPNNGFLGVYDAGGTNQAGMYVNSSGQGVVYGDVKNFRIPHPNRSGQEIWYASLEGPEAAAYLRGTATLQSGSAVIRFPEHFRAVAQASGLTVQLTPLDASSKGLAVVEKTTSGFRVQELMQGRGSYAFDWEVKSVRRGYEDYQVVRPANDISATIQANPDGGEEK